MDKFITIKEKISSLNKDAKLVTVSKYMQLSRIKELYDLGQRDFGENKVQDLKAKMEIYKELDIRWHFLGNLQTNKINHLISLRPTLWQSCVSFELAKAVDKRLSYTLDTLLEINVADEDSKHGIDTNRAYETYQKIQNECKNINLIGIMSIAAHSDDESLITQSFDKTYEIYESLKEFGARICSMGMSSDYTIALKHGSNMVRIGSALH
ncbi:MAG: YggS family pyridoxal phosphate-dependent enzyme [Campylobacter sp.]|nr:YggS family pyridoxal phosphate-dependent enzyme [Campylobacter sp.]